MSVNNTDYTSLWNQQKLNTATGLLGNTSNTNIAGLSGDMINQWAMRGANSAAYKKLLEAQETGTIKKNQNYTELLSDKYFNDNYDTTTGKYTNATYKPDETTTATIDSELTAGEHLDNMRRLALAAINNPDSLTSTHYDMFEQMRQTIANSFVGGSGSTDDTEVTIEEATGGKVVGKTDFHLLTDQQNFTVAGSKGEKNYTFAEGASLQEIVTAINADSDATGVKAAWTKDDDGNYSVTVTSTDTGKDSFARVDQNVGDLFAAAGQSVKGAGTDALKEKAETVATSDDTQAAMVAGVYTGALFNDQTFTITGAKGSQEFKFDKGASVEDVAAAINAASEAIGVSAEVVYNAAGEAEGIGLLASKAGTGQYIQVTQTKGDLFANEGKTVKVDGSSNGTDSSSGASITDLKDLGKVSVDGKTYSFADLVNGGGASLAKNPDAALAVLDQALKDIYEGRAVIKGFDPAESPMPNISSGPKASTNAMEIGNYGSQAMTDWISKYIQEDETA